MMLVVWFILCAALSSFLTIVVLAVVKYIQSEAAYENQMRVSRSQNGNTMRPPSEP